MYDAPTEDVDDEPASARDAVAAIRAALAVAATVAVGLVAWNVLAAIL